MGVLLTKSTMPIVKWVAEVMGWLMNGIYSIGVHNLGLCIIIFTVIIYAMMTPLQIKQQKFAKMNTVMNPELQKIQKKYRGKNDQNSQMKMQEETMAVYEKYGVSPTGSCLQMLIQMPVFLALYQVIIKIPGYISGMRHVFDAAVSHITEVNGFSGIIQKFIQTNGINNSYIPMSGELNNNQVIDFLYSLSPSQWDKLADVDKFQGFAHVLDQTADKLQPMQNFLGLNIADTPWALIKSGWSTHHYVLIFAAFLIPFLAWATQVLSMKLTPTTTDSNNKSGVNSQMEASMKSMNIFMPLFTAFICFTFPVGIGIYWIIGAVVRIVQQIVINKHLNNMDMEEFIRKNKEKMDKKRAKSGVTSQNISEYAKMNVRNIQEPQRKTITEKSNSVQNTTSGYYTSVPKTKPGSLASKANMVAAFDEKNKGKKK